MITIHPTDLDRARLVAAAGYGATIEADLTDYTGRVIQKPWGKEWEVYRNDQFSIWRLDLRRNSETSMHAHRGKTTILSVGEGEIIFSTLEKRFTLSQGQVVVIEKGVFHKSETVGGAVVIEIESPPNKHDLVRIADKYGREGMGYESV